MTATDELIRNNETYAADFDKSKLPMPPATHVAVVACMDARLDPARALGLEEGDAHVIRNAGGLATDDALRSLVISRTLLGTQEAFVIGHTDCGMETFTNDQIHAKLHDELGADASAVDFEPFPHVHESVAASVRRLRDSDLVPDDYPIRGFVYDVKTGRIDEVDA